MRAGVVTSKARAALSKTKAIALDVDGVLTDDTFGWDADGNETKRFAFLDVMGVSRATKAGFVFALVSGEATSFVDRYAKKMSIGNVFQGTRDKAGCVRELAKRLDLSLDEIMFVGNDVNDLEAMEIVGFCAAPVDAHPSVLARVDYVAERGGGHGAVREVLDLLMTRDEPVPEPVKENREMSNASDFFKSELEAHLAVFERLVDDQGVVLEQLTDAFIACFKRGNKLLFCGNGGSAADSQHIAAEFINRFRYDRAALPAIALTVDTSVLTCIGNDAAFEQVFSRQVEALAQPGDIVIGITTSGKSANVLRALEAAKKKKAIAVGFTGQDGHARLAPITDMCFATPSNDTARIQEGHEFALHSIAALVESAIFPQDKK